MFNLSLIRGSFRFLILSRKFKVYSLKVVSQMESYALIESGLEAMANGGYQQVHKDAINMIHKNVCDPIPYLLLAKLCLDHKNYKKSIELFTKSLELDPNNIYTLTKLHVFKHNIDIIPLINLFASFVLWGCITVTIDFMNQADMFC